MTRTDAPTIGFLTSSERDRNAPQALAARRSASSFPTTRGPIAARIVSLPFRKRHGRSPLTANLRSLPPMPKAYWIATYRAVHDPDALAAYARVAGPALQSAGGRVLARGTPAQVYEEGIAQRTVLIEFETVAQAVAAHDSPGYQEALRVLGNAVDRDIRIVEGAA